MKALVIFDSNYGNTKKVARAIALNLGRGTNILSASDVKKKDLKGIDLLVAGSPVIGWNHSEKMGAFLSKLKENDLKGIKAASFDTRMKLFSFTDAAKKISRKLSAAGANIISKPRAFFVSKSEGPLRDGELDKAAQWAIGIRKSLAPKRKVSAKKRKSPKKNW